MRWAASPWSVDRLLVGLRDRSGLLECSAPGCGLGLGLVCSSSVIRPSQTNGRTRGLRGWSEHLYCLSWPDGSCDQPAAAPHDLHVYLTCGMRNLQLRKYRADRPPPFTIRETSIFLSPVSILSIEQPLSTWPWPELRVRHPSLPIISGQMGPLLYSSSRRDLRRRRLSRANWVRTTICPLPASQHPLRPRSSTMLEWLHGRSSGIPSTRTTSATIPRPPATSTPS